VKNGKAGGGGGGGPPPPPTPFLLVCASVTGIVAADEDVPNAVR